MVLYSVDWHTEFQITVTNQSEYWISVNHVLITHLQLFLCNRMFSFTLKQLLSYGMVKAEIGKEGLGKYDENSLFKS